MFESRAFTFAVGLICLVYFARPALAFGAGNIASISKIEGQNWRHGDIEDALLRLTMAKAFGGKKFSKHNISRVYFGNWLRDYSQAIDVGTVKAVSAEAIRLLLSVLGFMTFGFGSQEFEITTDRIGCYRPEEHIDNPKNYADNEDARNYYERLRGPVDESVELAIDEETGMKNYIANEEAGIDTSAGLCRDLITRCINLGRSYARSGDKTERNESLRLMGTALHCLEDYFAHSNYTELALIELGERDVFPHVGRNTQMRLPGVRHSVYPIVTGTFGGVDFLHSVTGEVSDKLTQNEIQELEGTLEESTQADTSFLRDLLDKIPSGVFGGENESEKVEKIQADAAEAQAENQEVSPREPEEFTLYIQNIFRQIMPVLEWHDNIVKKINNAVEKIPVLPKIKEQLGDQLSMFIFSIIAPLILPVIRQIRNEMKTGSDELIASSEKEQFIVFHDDDSTDPTHSMLAKDHFSNILNEVAGRCAAYTVRWVVPQIMDAIDDEDVDIDRTVDRITGGILHHPAQRDDGRDGSNEGRQLLFNTVEEWWHEGGSERQEEYRYKLSRKGVKNTENHKEGVHDTGHGHGCVGALKMRKQFGEEENWEDKVAETAVDTISGALSGMVGGKSGDSGKSEGGLGGIIGGIGSLLSGGDSDSKREDSRQTESYSSQQRDDHGYSESHTSRRYGDDGSYSQSYSNSRRDDDGGYHQSQTSQYSQPGYQQSSSYGRQQSSGGSYSESQSYSSQQQYSGRSHTQQSGYGAAASYQGSSGGGYGGSHGGDSRYQSQQSNYGGRDDSSSSRYGQREESYSGRHGGGHGEDSRHSRRDHSPSSRYGGQQSGYGAASSYQGRQQRSRSSSSDRSSGHHGRRHGGHSGSHGGDSRYQSQQQSGYGNTSSYSGRHQGGHSSSSDSSSGHHDRRHGGHSGSHGGDSRYQSQQQSGYGSASQYQGGQSGYGGSQGGYGGSHSSSQQQSGYGSSSQYQGGQGGYGGSQSQGGYGGSQGGYGGSHSSSYGGGYGGGQGGDPRYQSHQSSGGSASQYPGSQSQGGGYGGYGNTGYGSSGYQQQRRW